MKSDWKFAVAEIFGIAALIAALFGHLLLMGSERVSGAGLFLMPITIAGYLIFTWLSQRNKSAKAYWIFYAVKIALTAFLLISAPLVSRLAARLING